MFGNKPVRYLTIYPNPTALRFAFPVQRPRGPRPAPGVRSLLFHHVLLKLPHPPTGVLPLLPPPQVPSTGRLPCPPPPSPSAGSRRSTGASTGSE